VPLNLVSNAAVGYLISETSLFFVTIYHGQLPIFLSSSSFFFLLPSSFLSIQTLPAGMDMAKYKGSILPIAALQGASLWLSNLAYLYIG
jgi:hypothetical protein